MEDKIRKALISIVACLWLSGQLYLVFAPVPGMVIRPLHVGFCLMLVFLTKPFPGGKRVSILADCAVCIALSAFMLHFLKDSTRIVERIPFVDSLTRPDIVLSLLFIILLLEAGRRVLGWSMTVVALIFMGYSFFGKSLPWIFSHPGTDLMSFIETQTMTTRGIFTSPIAASSDTIFYFMIFGGYIAATPAGKLFVSFAKYMSRNSVGGAGKSAVIASGLFGLISGSAAANVASVGVLTYPLMEKEKFKPVFSAALLATAGTGGQLSPPIMGAAAFIMADMIGVSYFKIILYAIMPSIIYIGSLFWEVHLEAGKLGMKTASVDTKELLATIKSLAHLMLPVALLVTLIAAGRSLMYSAMASTLSLIVLCQIRKDTRLSLGSILKMAIDGTRSAVIVTLPCALAGIVVGEIVMTGLGLRFSAVVASLSEGNLLFALLLSTAMIIVVGLGMPTSAAYILSAVLIGPALQRLGIMPIVAHMFIFYFANMSMITPPVAIAAYTAAGIAKTGLWETSIEAVRLALILFLIPFVFIYNPALLGIGTPLEMAWAFFTCSMGAMGLGIGIIGYWRGKISIAQRIVYIIAALCLIVPEFISSIAGMAIIAILMWTRYRKTSGEPQ